MSSKKLNPFKDFQSDQIQRSSRKIFTAHYACRNAALNLTPVTGTTNGFIFQIINSLIESWLVRFTSLDFKTRCTFVCVHVWKCVSLQSRHILRCEQWYFFGGDECSPPSCMLKLTESWGKSKTDFKGEVGGFKI